MVYLFSKKRKSGAYYYLGENKKVNGRSVRVWQKYVGPAKTIQSLSMGGRLPTEISVLEFGNITSLFSIGEELNFVEAVDKIIPKRHQGLTVGEHLLLTIINRIDNPLSKNQLSDWFDNTVLKRKFAIKSSYLSSQDFWNHWKKIDQEDFGH